MSKSIITLTTDLGTRDAYSGILKGTLLSLNPSLNLVDISHDIQPGDVMDGGWVLRQAYKAFPKGSVHLSAVGLNTLNSSHFLVVQYNEHFFVSPDNGLFSLVLSSEDEAEVYYVDGNKLNEKLEHTPTFLLYEQMAPVAVKLAAGMLPKEIGYLNSDMIRYKWAEPFCDRYGIQGMIHHIDHYGNLISNINVHLFEEQIGNQDFKMYIGNTIIRQLENHPARVEEQECFTFKGASGMMEIGIKGGNAAELLSVQKGAAISVVLS